MQKTINTTLTCLFLGIFSQLQAQIDLAVDTVYRGEALDITVTAENVDFTQGSNTVHFYSDSKTVYINNTVAISPTKLKIPVNFGVSDPVGFYDLEIVLNSSEFILTQKKAIYLAERTYLLEIDSISNKSGKQGETITVAFYGKNIGANLGDNSSIFYLKMDYHTISPKNISIISDDEVSVTFELSYSTITGTYDAYVENNAVGTKQIYQAFEVLQGSDAPRLVSLSRDTVLQGETLEYTLTGANVDFTQGTNMVHFSRPGLRFPVSNYKIISPTSLTFSANFDVNVPLGYYDLIMDYNNGIELFTIPNSIYVFTIDSTPVITAVDKIDAETGITTVDLLFYHLNSHINSVDNLIYLKNDTDSIFSDSSYSSFENSTNAIFNIENKYQLGNYTLVVENIKDGKLTFDNAFTIKEKPPVGPKIKTISLDTVFQSELLEIEITTEDYDFRQGSNIIHFVHRDTKEKVNTLNQTYFDSNKVKFQTIFNAETTLGDYDMVLAYNWGENSITLENAIYLLKGKTQAPEITSTPTSIQQGNLLVIDVLGKNTNFKNPEAYRNLFSLKNDTETIYPESFNVTNDTIFSLTFKIHYGHELGFYNLSAYNVYDGLLVIDSLVEITQGLNVPKILSVTIDSVDIFETFTIELNAENVDFTKGTNVVRLSRAELQIDVKNVSVTDANNIVMTAEFNDNSSETLSGYYDLVISNTESGITLVKTKAIYLRPIVIDGLDDKKHKQLVFYPNPAVDIIHFDKAFETVSVLDLKGNVIAQFNNASTIDVNGIEKGTYLLKILDDSDQITQKIIID